METTISDGETIQVSQKYWDELHKKLQQEIEARIEAEKKAAFYEGQIVILKQLADKDTES